VGLANVLYAIFYCVLFFQETFYCHTVTNEARSSRILLQNLLLEGKCRNESIEELKMFSLQLQVKKNEYTAREFFSLNLRLFGSVVSVIVS